MSRKYKYVLASKSPRRKQLMEQSGLSFTIRTKDIEENYPESLKSIEVAEYLARLKCAEMIKTAAKDELIICADTIVVLEDQILGKPKNTEEAIEYLNLLSGKKHMVITGVCLMSEGCCRSFKSITDVEFFELKKAEIEQYVHDFQPFDKAGAYAIQERIGIAGIKEIKGCYYNVVGLPLSSLIQELREFEK